MYQVRKVIDSERKKMNFLNNKTSNANNDNGKIKLRIKIQQ